MVKKEKIKEKIDINEQSKDISKVWAENYTGFLKMWSDSHLKLYKPIIESMGELSEKASNISQESVPEKYKEFYNLWIKTHQDNYSRLVDEQSMKPSKETFDNFTQNVNIYLNMYRSWITALEKMSEKSKELSEITNPEAYKEFCDLWVKMYEKAFDTFFEDMPMVGPMKGTMEPVKVAAKTYADAYVKISRMLTKSTFGAASRA